MLGLQWQWQANSNPLWYFPAGDKGYLRLFAWNEIDAAKNLWDAPNLLMQKFPAPNFKFTTSWLQSFQKGERAGLVVFGQDYGTITIESTDKGLVLNQSSCKNAPDGTPETINATEAISKKHGIFSCRGQTIEGFKQRKYSATESKLYVQL